MSQNFFKKSQEINLAASGENRIAVNLFFKNAAAIISHYEQWEYIDRFYFITLKLNMVYFCGGLTLPIAYPPYFIGTIVRNSLDHPELFAEKCECGHTAYAYSYNGSPLSGRFDLSYACPHCGANFSDTKSVWHIRIKILTATQEEDFERGRHLQSLNSAFEPASINKLLHLFSLCND